MEHINLTEGGYKRFLYFIFIFFVVVFAFGFSFNGCFICLFSAYFSSYCFLSNLLRLENENINNLQYHIQERHGLFSGKKIRGAACN